MRERLRAQGSGSRRGSGSVRAWERGCQSQPRHRHRLRRAGTERPRVRHGGRPYWKRARARAPALASEGRGGAQGPAPSVPTPGRLRWGVCSPRSPGAPTPRPALRIPWASLTGRAGAANRTLSPLPGPGGGGRQARSGQELRWWPKLPGGSDGSHVGDRSGGGERPRCAAALACGRGPTAPPTPGQTRVYTAMSEASRDWSVRPESRADNPCQ